MLQEIWIAAVALFTLDSEESRRPERLAANEFHFRAGTINTHKHASAFDANYIDD
jgi:hypothetical protein